MSLPEALDKVEVTSGASELLRGHKEFLNTTFKHGEDEYERLAKEGQSPKTLYFSCSDSRVVPNFITNSAPGEIFVHRNVGNFIPHFNSNANEAGATIEFAVNVLGVKEIIVCSHQHCGACASLYNDELDIKKFPHLSQWLSHGKNTRKIVEHMIKNGEIKEEEKREMTEKVSVLEQIRNLMTYPNIKEKVENNELELYAWYFTIETGCVEYYDQVDHAFKIYKGKDAE
eukprot:gene2525-3230_t